MRADVSHARPLARRDCVRVPVVTRGVQFRPMRIPIETFRLPNGLFVTLSEDHTAPIVAVNLWYHVGSANERAGPHRIRAPVRAHALPRLGRRRGERALRARAARRRNAERIDVARAHELLRDRSVEPARARPLARSEPHGQAAAGDDAAEARHAARRRDERAPLDDGQPAVRHVDGKASGAVLSARASVPSFADGVDGRPHRREPGRHRAVLRDVLHAGQRGAVDRRRFRAGRSATAGRAALRRAFRAAAGKPPLPDMSLPPVFGQWKREVVPDDVMLPRLFLAFRSPAFGTDAVLSRRACAARSLAFGTGAAASGGSFASARSRPMPRHSPTISRRAAICSSSMSRRGPAFRPNSSSTRSRTRSTLSCATA